MAPPSRPSTKAWNGGERMLQIQGPAQEKVQGWGGGFRSRGHMHTCS